MSSSEKFSVSDGYELAQLGPKTREIPHHWDVRKLGAIVNINMGSSPKSKYYNEQGDGLAFFQGNADFGTHHPQVTVWCTNPNKTADGGDLLLSVRAPVGDLNIATQHCCIGRGLAAISAEEADSGFLYYLLSFERSRLQTYAQGSTFKSVNSGVLNNFPVQFPPLSEQRRIAEILSTVDEQIERTDEMIKKTEKLKQGLMQDLLIGGLSSGPTQEIQIGPRTLHIPDYWDMEPCGQLFEAINGRAFKTEEWEEEGIQIIRIQDLRPDAEAETNYADFEVDDKYHVTDGDLLFCWAGNINTSLGAYIWSGDDAYLNQHIYNLRPKKELDKRFFAFSLNQHLRLLKTMVGGSAGQVHITKGDFEAFKLPVPPIEEQERISNIIGCAQKKMEEEKSKKDDLQELKRGLMQDLLTGKVLVNTD